MKFNTNKVLKEIKPTPAEERKIKKEKTLNCHMIRCIQLKNIFFQQKDMGFLRLTCLWQRKNLLRFVSYN